MGIPAVTILIDTCNHERFIEEAIVSASEQDFPRAETEILVVDDGSTDHTPEIVQKFRPHVSTGRRENGVDNARINRSAPPDTIGKLRSMSTNQRDNGHESGRPFRPWRQHNANAGK